MRIEGNESADELTKEAALKSTTTYLEFVTTITNQAIKRQRLEPLSIRILTLYSLCNERIIGII